MALPTNTFATYESIGNREDLTDIIYNIAPFVTPYLSSVGTAEAKAKLHEWQTDSLAAASGTNAQLEGDDASTDATVATVRLGNYAQISTKTPRVTGTQQAIVKAGRSDELAYQIAKRARELKRDMETSLLANTARAAGSDAVASVCAGIVTCLKTNESVGAGGVAPVTILTTTRTDGTQRAFTESLLLPVLKAVFDAGGDPDTIMVGSFNKQKFSGFTGNATKMVNVEEKKLTASVDVYESDYGVLKVVPNRFQRSRDALVLQLDMWAVAYLRSFHTKELARTGDSERQQLIVEYTQEARQEAASGIVADLTTS